MAPIPSREPVSDRALTFLSKLKALFGRHRDDVAFDEEILTHLDLLAAKFQREGMTPSQAVRAARRQFGNPTLLKQRQRESRTIMFFAHIFADARYAFRQLAKTPVFTIVCILTLALGVGANTAVFSVMHTVLMKMIPAHEPTRLVVLRESERPDGTTQSGDGYDNSFTYAMYQALSTRKDAFQDVMTYVPLAFSGKTPVRVGATPEVASGDMVSGNYFSGLGIGMERGRGFSSQDESQHASVVVISEKYWSSRFSRDPQIIGKTIFIKSLPFTIVGVAAHGFEGTEGARSLDFWIPLQDRPEFNAWGNSVGTDNKNFMRRDEWWCIRLMARLAPGISPQQALAQVFPTFRQAAYLGVPQAKQGQGKPPILSFSAPKQFGEPGDNQTKSLHTLMTMVVLVLLIAVSNVVMLLLARNANRQREFSIRLALGAGRMELARQLLVESFLLVTTGGVVAWLFASIATRALASWAQIDSSLQPDETVLWFTLAVLFIAALIFGLAPLRSAMSNDPQLTLKSSTAVSQHSAQKVRAGNAVIVTQVALCVVLLVGAGLLFGTLRNLINTPLGMKADGLLVFGVHPKHFTSTEQSVAFYQTFQQRLSALPGVTAVSMVENRPGSGWSNNDAGILIDGHKPVGSPDDTHFRNNGVGSNYFHTMGVHILAGRDFTDADTATAPKVVVVNETFAKRYVGPGSAVGHVVSASDQKDHYQIIGVVQDHKYTGITEETTPMLWSIFTQGSPEGELNYELRVQGEPMALLEPARRVAAQMDPDMPLLRPMTQAEQFTLSISEQILFARLAGCFGALAVVLIATGLYGTLSYRVSKRSPEIGVRMALGAQRSQVVWMVLRGSLTLTAAGVLLGVPLAVAACRGLESSLYGIKPLDPVSYALAIAGVVLVALLASTIPAGRAASVDPSRALRAD